MEGKGDCTSSSAVAPRGNFCLCPAKCLSLRRGVPGVSEVSQDGSTCHNALGGIVGPPRGGWGDAWGLKGRPLRSHSRSRPVDLVLESLCFSCPPLSHVVFACCVLPVKVASPLCLRTGSWRLVKLQETTSQRSWLVLRVVIANTR